MNVEILRVQADVAEEFLRSSEREALKTLYDFNVVWHEQTHYLAAYENATPAAREDIAVATSEQATIIGAAKIKIAASLAHIEWIIVLPVKRRNGIGRALLADASDLGNYYNCHKMSAMVPHRSAAQSFFEACDYKEEAVLQQHTFKLDMAVLRKFLL